MGKERRAKAIFDCTGDDELELTFNEGDIILNVEETAEDGWLHGKLERTGEQGLFPDNYVELFEVETAPMLPTKQAGAQSIASPASITGLTHSATEKSKPALPGRTTAVSNMAGRVALPQLSGARSSLSPAPLSRPTDSGVSGGPPTLPKRSNTMGSASSSADSNDSAPSTPPASIRERMANLSAAATSSQPQNIPVGSGLGLHPGGTQPNGFGRSGVPVLPSRPNAGSGKEPTGANATARSNIAPSPLSSAARPALPPRALAGSPLGTGSSKASPSSSGASTSLSSTPRSFQVASAEAPAPKLTTFSRPRSARSSKTATSPASSPSEEKRQQATSPKSTSSVVSTPPNTAPKLPARSATSTSLMSTSSDSTTSSGSTGPIRFTSMRDGSGRDAGTPKGGPTAPTVVAALPTISRNAQPLPLSSRPTPATSTAADALAKQDTTSRSTIADRPALPGRSHEKQNELDMAPPPLPARSSTIPIGDEATRSSVAATLPERSATTRQSPGFKYQPVASQQYLKRGGSPTNNSSSNSPLNPASSSARSSMPGAFHVGRPTLYKGGQRLNGSNTSLASDPASISGSSGGTNKAPWMHKSLGATTTTRSHVGEGGGLATANPVILPPSPTVGIRPEALKRYEALFESKVGNNGYIDGVQVYAIFVKSRLDSKTLAQIWDLVDVSSRGALTKAQFCMGLYLIDERLGSGVIPLELSAELWASARSVQ